MMKLLTTLFMLFGLWAGAAQAQTGLTIEDPWVREAPPTAKALGGFMVVHNSGDEARALVGAESPLFGNTMIHRTIMEDGMAKMVHQMRVDIPAGESVEFKPGDFHIMLMEPKQALKAGDTVPVTLKFADGETMEVTYEVRAAGAGMGHGKMQH